MEGIEFSLTIIPQNSSNLNSSEVIENSLIVLPLNPPNHSFSVTLKKIPVTFSELMQETQNLFNNYQIVGVFYKDSDNDLISIQSNSDLKAAYTLGKRCKDFLQIFIKATEKPPEIAFSAPFVSETPPDVIKETYMVPCYKCLNKPKCLEKKCEKCAGQSLIDVYSDSKLNVIRNIIRTEMENYLPKLMLEVSSENSSVVHSGVACNGCDTYPLIGNRYKCSVCVDFDFCQQCEKSTYHEHPFVKIKSPDQAPKILLCAVNDSRSKPKPKNRQCIASTRLLCRFVKDVIGNEGDVHSPGEIFIKSWRLRNDGATQWPRGCKLVFTNGDFGGDDVNLPYLKPGEEKDVSVTCRSPDKDGRYNSYWRAVDPCGNRFGHRLSIMINVKHGENEELGLLREIFNNPELVRLAYQKAGGSKQKAAELLLSGNIL